MTLTGNLELLKQLVREKRFDELSAVDTGCFNARVELLKMFSELFQVEGPKVNADGSVTNQFYIEYDKWTLPDVIEKIKKNRNKLKF